MFWKKLTWISMGVFILILIGAWFEFGTEEKPETPGTPSAAIPSQNQQQSPNNGSKFY